MPDPAGYSGTPLVRKLGIRPRGRVLFVNAPRGFRATLGRLSAGVTTVAGTAGNLDFALVFAPSARMLRSRIPSLARRLSPTGMIWMAWPKKTSGVASDLNFDVVQRIGLDAGLVDTKICAVDATWSALRFVVRVRDRPAPGKPPA